MPLTIAEVKKSLNFIWGKDRPATLQLWEKGSNKGETNKQETNTEFVNSMLDLGDISILYTYICSCGDTKPTNITFGGFTL